VEKEIPFIAMLEVSWKEGTSLPSDTLQSFTAFSPDFAVPVARSRPSGEKATAKTGSLRCRV
jgi:hypothetical protein